MTAAYRLWENAQIVGLLDPATDSAGRTSSYISMNNAIKGYVVCYVQQGSATAVEWTVLQAQDDNGTNAKAVTAMPIVANESTATSDTFVSETAAVNYTNTTAEANKIVIFEIQPESCMDINNATPFTHIAIQTAASSASNVTSALFIGTPVKNALFPPQTVNV